MFERHMYYYLFSEAQNKQSQNNTHKIIGRKYIEIHKHITHKFLFFLFNLHYYLDTPPPHTHQINQINGEIALSEADSHLTQILILVVKKITKNKS